MPELPDVETFRAMVEGCCKGASVTRVTVCDATSLQGATGPVLQRRLMRHPLRSATRHGKYLFLDFGEAAVLVMHFGPAGSLFSVRAGQDKPAYARVRFEFSNIISLVYANRRRIGSVRLVDSVESFSRQTRLGPDAMNKAFGVPEFSALLAKSRQPIKALLTNQSKLSGIGNTWSDEILFQGRIHPVAPGNSLSANQCRRLFKSMRSVLQTAIDLDPTKADFRERLRPAKFLLPHRHPGGRCPRSGSELSQLRISGHTSFYCEHCQASGELTPTHREHADHG